MKQGKLGARLWIRAATRTMALPRKFEEADTAAAEHIRASEVKGTNKPTELYERADGYKDRRAVAEQNKSALAGMSRRYQPAAKSMP
jgi:hypothetical protein